MRVVSLARLKAGLSHYLQLLSRGDSLLITEHNLPVARLVPLSLKQDEAALLEVLDETGIVSAPARTKKNKRKKPEAGR